MNTGRQGRYGSSLRRNLLLLFGFFLVSYLGVLFFVHQEVRVYALKEAESQIEKFLYSYRAVRHLVSDEHKQEVYRLQEEGVLHEEYFSPQLLSSTFNARHYLDYLNDELDRIGQPRVRFKLAADNPRNPENRADAWERDLLNRVRAGEKGDFKEVLREDGEEFLFYAMATDSTTEKCLRCHGDPNDAPEDMLAQYGDRAGFFEEPGNVRAIISMRVPLADYYVKADRFFKFVAWTILAIFSLLYALTSLCWHRLDTQKNEILRQKEELERLSCQDQLTRSFNRHGFLLQMDGILKRAARYDEPLGLIMFDLDRFKAINDTYGHAVGDDVLIGVVGRVNSTLRESDLLCRWGGEEFLIALPATPRQALEVLAERIRAELAAAPVTADLVVTASFGATEFYKGDSIETMVSRADQAVYEAKHNGRNQVRFNFV